MSFDDPITTYAQALATSSSDEILEDLLDDMASEGVNVSGFGDFSVQRALPELEARALAVFQSLRATLVLAGNPTTAPQVGDDWTDIVCQGFFAETRIPAKGTSISLTLSTVDSGAGPYTLNPGDIVAQDDAGNTFTSYTAAILPANGTVIVGVTSTGKGGSTNPAIGHVSTIIVGPAGIECTNASGSVISAGRDAETSVAYVARCIAKWGTKGAGGNRPAWNYRIPNADADVNRWVVRDDNPFGPGTVGVALANGSGPATDDDVIIVNAALQKVLTLGAGTLHVFKSPANTIDVVAELLTDGSNPDAAAQATAAILGLSSNLPISGGPAYPSTQVVRRDRLIAIFMAIQGVVDINSLTPSGNVSLAPYEVPVLVPTITQVSL